MIDVRVYDTNLASPTLERIITEDLQNLRFASRVPGGFYRCSFDLRMDIFEAWQWLTGKIFHRLVIADGKKTLWEGRIEDISLSRSGVSVMAYGYYANLSDKPYATAYNDVWSTVLDTILTANCAQISATRHFTTTDRVADSGAGDDWLDRTPMELVEKFLPLSDSTDQIWDFCVWEDREAWLAPRSPTALNWTCTLSDFADFRLKYIGKNLFNSSYARYQSGGALARTAAADDATSQTKYGVTRQYAIEDMGAVAAQEAQTARDAYVAKNKDLWPVFSSPPVLGEWVLDANGVRTPSSCVRAGQVLRIKDLVPASGLLDSVSLNAMQTVFITETEYDLNRRQLTLYFDRDPQTLSAILARKL